MGPNERNIFWICVIVCMALSIMALAIALPRSVDMSNPTSLDYQGVFVAILALLVTLLIGWQINSALSLEKKVEANNTMIKEKISEIESMKTSIDKTSEASRNLNLGIYYCLASAANYNQMRFGRDKDKSEKVKELIRSYTLAGLSILYILKSNMNIENLEDPIQLSISMVKIAKTNLFSYNNELIKNLFTEENHKLCDQLYSEIIKSAEVIGIENINIINDARAKRMALK